MQRGCTDRWCCANKQTGASKESKLKPLYYSLVLWAQAVGCRQGVTTNTCKLLLLIKITSHLHGTGTCSADHSKAKLRILPHALIIFSGAPYYILLYIILAIPPSHCGMRKKQSHATFPPHTVACTDAVTRDILSSHCGVRTCDHVCYLPSSSCPTGFHTSIEL
jgi:hypothetical protein